MFNHVCVSILQLCAWGGCGTPTGYIKHMKSHVGTWLICWHLCPYSGALRALPKLPLGRALSHHKQEAGCIYVNNAGPWNAIIHLGYTVTKDRLRLVLVLTTLGLVLTFSRLKRDVRRTSLTLAVVLPNVFSNFQSAHSGVTCTV